MSTLEADAEEAKECRGDVIQAAKKGLEGAVRHFLREDPTCVKKKDRIGYTALHFAAANGRDSIMELLLEQKAEIDNKMTRGWTPLHRAAANGHGSAVELLLKHNANAAVKDHDGKKPVDVAKKDEIKALLGKAEEAEEKLKPASECKDSQSSESATAKGSSDVFETLRRYFRADGTSLQADAEEAKQCRSVHRAAKKGLKGAVRHFLKEEPTCVKEIDGVGNTALHLAALNGHRSIAELLLKHNADAAAKNNIGQTALHLAAASGHRSTVELLLKNKAPIEGKSIDGDTALHFAAANGRDSIMELLLEQKAEVDAMVIRGSTALHFAAANGRDSTVELLLKHGADAGVKDMKGKKPVDVAKKDEIKALLGKAEEEVGAETEEVAQCKGILDAAERGLVNAAQHFIRNDPKCIEMKDAEGLTPLHVATKHGHRALVETLLRQGASLEARDGFGQTALHWAACCCHVPIVRLLCSEGAILDVKENDGLTPAQLAEQEAHDEVVYILQEFQAAKGEEQADAEEAGTCKGGIIQAAADGLSGAVRHFLKDPESIQLKDKRFGKTALHLASEKGHATIVRMLLRQGAAADATTLDGRSALHFAAANGHISVVQLLISHGATPYVRGNNGKTPADVAQENGHKEITDLLPFRDPGDPAREGSEDLEEGDSAMAALQEVIQDMLAHPADSEVQSYGCAVISALCKRGFQDFAVENGALEALVAALEAHPEAQRRACLALQHLLQGTAAAGRRGRALEAGAVEALLAAPRHALGALGALGGSRKALPRMVDGKVVAMLLGAMRDERTAPEAVKALAALARGLAEYAPEEFNSEMKKALGAVSPRGLPEMEKCLDHIRAVYQDVLEECPIDRPEYWSATTSDMGWLAHPVGSEVLSVLMSMFQVHKPEELGLGRDAKAYHRKYTDLRVHRAWRIEHENWMGFMAERRKVQEAIKRIWPKVRLPFWESKLEEASRNLPGRAYLEQTGERFLLHGTKPELILSILHEGFNASLSKGTFGDGCYFAEDPEKIDQYTQPHTKDDGLKELHERLWQDRPHPGGDIFYCFVARVICGATFQTEGLDRSSPPKDATTGAEVFATKEARELVHIPGTSPAERYHSLLANLATRKIDGRSVIRFREIVSFKGERIYPEYLLAYQRV